MTANDGFVLSELRVIQPRETLYSMSEMRITKTSVSFNRACASELGYPEEVCLVASDDAALIGLVTRSAYDAENIRYYPFFDKDASPSKRITLKDKYATASLRNTLGWEDKETRRIFGHLDATRQVILFMARDAVLLSQKVEKRGKRVPTVRDYPRLSDFLKKATPLRFGLAASNPTVDIPPKDESIYPPGCIML